MDRDFDINVTEVGRRGAVVAVTGELDLSTAPALKWTLVDLPAVGRNLAVLDFTELDFIDSTALGVIVAARRSFETLAIATTQPVVLNVLEITGLDAGFAVFDSVAEAVEALALTPAGA